MANHKVVFLDIDGTIVDYDGNVPESAIRAIKQARKNGHKVFLTTGRSKAEIYSYLWDIGFDGLIGGNGSYVEAEGKVIHHQVIPVETLKKVVQWMKEQGVGYYLECNSGLYGSTNLPIEGAKLLGDPNKENITKFKSVFPDMIYDDEIIPEDVNKISFVLKPDIQMDDFQERFKDELQVSSWSLTGKKHEFGEFGQIGIHKAKAVRIILDHYRLNIEDTVAFGDALNDVEMIITCEIGVAMGNAEEVLKEVADYITRPIDEDGLYHGFEHLGLL